MKTVNFKNVGANLCVRPMVNFNIRPMVMIAIIAIGIFALTSCGGGSKKSSNDATASGSSETNVKAFDVSATAFSIKYEIDGKTVVFTKDANGQRKRLDYIYSNGDKRIYMYDFKADIARKYDGGEWKETDRMGNLSVEQNCNNFFASIKDLSDGYIKAGLTKQADQTIAGKKCTVIGGTFAKQPFYPYMGLRENVPVKIAVWNGLTMLIENDGKTELEAKAVTTDVPDEAFNKTVEVTWIN
jgi:hypothetical protein